MTNEAPPGPAPGPLAAAQADIQSEPAAPEPAPETSGEPTDADIVAELKGEVSPAEQTAEQASKAEEYLARVVKQQKRLREEQRRVRQEAERNAQALDLAKQYEELNKLAAQDPWAAYQKLNLDSNQLIKRMVEEGEKLRPLTVEERLERIEQQRQAELRAAEERAREEEASRHNQELEHHVNSYKNAVTQLAKENVDRYELINTYGQANRVWNAALDYYKQHKTIPNPDVVMDAVEQDLRTEIKKLLSTSYFRSLMQDYQASRKPAATVTRSPKPASLTNSIARTSVNLKKDEDEETDEEREQAAIAILSGLRR